MRCFLGFDLTAAEKLQLQSWCDKALPPLHKAVPPANYHITSVFLGQLEDDQLDHLTQALDTLNWDAFELHIDELGYWKKPRILYAGCQHIPDGANAVHRQLAAIAHQAGINVQHGHYVPHITVARKVVEPVPSPLFQPAMTIRLSQLHLFESVSGKQGVHYPIRRSWPCRLRSPGHRL
ncbi:RNA 2',3'-cyclic phosphodiesterase [Aestuariibacter halophilus]|uniref:RNA 2',3'-cyclic phosphodiesterase n=1 Tax=Fluctibacter halophilus TaxID=226011 RepID=A0ABS8GDY0_9ALTE|nr:RNA 2',3'-cyclic phosphodiesterase [Aestuariibacter halophilus]MCC2617416.1 RNA 2',3'-cyclic phosphodiesterase [Aestuariibacter halophilus]